LMTLEAAVSLCCPVISSLWAKAGIDRIHR
jgi:hypothetical protein